MQKQWTSNCKWGTPEEQANNCRSVPTFTYQGDTMSLSRWARKLQVTRGSLTSRLRKGWSLEQTLSVPIRPHKPYKPR